MSSNKAGDTKPTPARGSLPRIVLHGVSPDVDAFGLRLLSNIDKPVDVTKYTTFLSITESVKAPFLSGTLRFAMPVHQFFSVFPGARARLPGGKSVRIPQPGFWVVARIPSRRSLGHSAYGDGEVG